MEIKLNKHLLSIITIKPEKISGGGVPVFKCESREEMERISFALGKVTNGMVHELDRDIYVIVRH